MGTQSTDGTSVPGGGWLPACRVAGCNVAGCNVQADQVQPAWVVGKAAPSPPKSGDL